MRRILQNELALINILVVLLIIIITFFPSNISRIILGSPFLIFFPGYTLVAAIFPRRGTLGGIERVALSFGLSIGVVPLIALALNYTPWGITLYPVLLSLTIFTLLTSVIAWYRRERLAQAERFAVSLNLKLPQWKGQHVRDKLMPIILIVTILGAIGTLSYAFVTPKIGDKFTEFYILGLEGKAIDYPTELGVGEEGRVIVGIINREHEKVNYWVEVTIDGMTNSRTGPLELEHDEKWEDLTSFTPDKAGNSQKVEFLLYRNEESDPYLRLYLWVDVTK